MALGLGRGTGDERHRPTDRPTDRESVLMNHEIGFGIDGRCLLVLNVHHSGSRIRRAVRGKCPVMDGWDGWDVCKVGGGSVKEKNIGLGRLPLSRVLESSRRDVDVDVMFCCD